MKDLEDGEKRLEQMWGIWGGEHIFSGTNQHSDFHQKHSTNEKKSNIEGFIQ